MAEGARLESVYTATYREFESLTHRHIQNPSRNAGVFSFWAVQFAIDRRPSVSWFVEMSLSQKRKNPSFMAWVLISVS